MGTIRELFKIIVVISPVIFGAYCFVIGFPIFMSAETLTELIKGIIISAFGVIFGVFGFFAAGSFVYD